MKTFLLVISALSFPLSVFSQNVATDNVGAVNASTRRPLSRAPIDYYPEQLKRAGHLVEQYAFRDLNALATDEVNALISGLTAGTSAQNLFSTRSDSGGGTYVRSTTWFGHSLDLTCMSVWNSAAGFGTTQFETATLISPRHVLMAHHYFPANGTQFRFVAADGTVVTRTLSSHQLIGSTDIEIGYLDSDVPASITFAKALSSSIHENQLHGAPVIFTDQNQKAFIGQLTAAGPLQFAQFGTSPLSTFWKTPVSGDSSHPMFVVLDGTLCVLGSLHTPGGTEDGVGTQYAAVNAAMTSLGGSYQLTPFNAAAVDRTSLYDLSNLISLDGDARILRSAGDVAMLDYSGDYVVMGSGAVIDGFVSLTGPDGGISIDVSDLESTYSIIVPESSHDRTLDFNDGRVRVATQFDKTDTTLANVTGLTVNVLAGKTYSFRSNLFVTLHTSGLGKIAFGGTATATAVRAGILAPDDGDGSATESGTVSSLGSAFSLASNGISFVRIEGTITVNTGGTLTVQFAQNSATGTSSVLVGSTFEVREIP